MDFRNICVSPYSLEPSTVTGLYQAQNFGRVKKLLHYINIPGLIRIIEMTSRVTISWKTGSLCQEFSLLSMGISNLKYLNSSCEPRGTIVNMSNQFLFPKTVHPFSVSNSSYASNLQQAVPILVRGEILL